MTAERAHPERGVNGRSAGARASRCALVAAALLAWLAPVAPSSAQVLLKEPPAEIRGLDVVEKTGERAALDVQLTDSKGNAVPFSSMFDGKRPVVLALVYYSCPVACPAILSKLQGLFNSLDHSIGPDYRVAIVSFDPRNSTEMAAEQKAAYQAGYRLDGRGVTAAEVAQAWEFFTAPALSSRTLADSVGFQYRFLPESGEFSHPTMFVVLTPEGVVSRYFYGFEYPARDVKLALLEASEGKTARTLGERFLLFCYHYDPASGTYTLAAVRVMQLGGGVSVVLLGGLVAGLKLAETRRSKNRPEPVAHDAASPALSGHRA